MLWCLVFACLFLNLNQLPAAKKRYPKTEHHNKSLVVLILSQLYNITYKWPIWAGLFFFIKILRGRSRRLKPLWIQTHSKRISAILWSKVIIQKSRRELSPVKQYTIDCEYLAYILQKKNSNKIQNIFKLAVRFSFSPDERSF